ncbi:MAG: HPF/RaiA family ribosome-associated protein [Candidatus Andersenbacteria bacterium]|nr:HPF/RaiA family ribosome-associated protein [Candidatus Andersenbacteria bacterium]
MELGDADITMMDKKLARLKKHLLPPYTTDVRCMRSTHHAKGDVITCSVNIEQSGKVFHAERAASTIQDALDEVIEVLEKELGRAHDKRKSHN